MFKYLVIGLGGALALALGGLYWQTQRLERANQDIAVLEADATATAGLVAAQNGAIEDLKRIESERLAAMTAAGARIADLHAKLSAERSKRKATVEKDYALPNCATFLATDVAAVCPAHARRLRDSAGSLPGS